MAFYICATTILVNITIINCFSIKDGLQYLLHENGTDINIVHRQGDEIRVNHKYENWFSVCSNLKKMLYCQICNLKAAFGYGLTLKYKMIPLDNKISFLCNSWQTSLAWHGITTWIWISNAKNLVNLTRSFYPLQVLVSATFKHSKFYSPFSWRYWIYFTFRLLFGIPWKIWYWIIW